MALPLEGWQPTAVRRASRMAGRVALIILALGALAMSLGLAVGIGTHLEGRDGARRETVILRQQPFQSEAGEAASTEGARTAVTASPTAGPVLQRFHTALAALEAGQRDKVVTVLHLGDGHISGDRLDAHMRTLLQSRFGDAGRGMLLPAGIVKGYRARGLRFDISGHWTGATALESTTAVLGLSGVQATASSPQSEMTVSLNEGRFDYVEVAFLSGPDRGSATVSIDGRPHAIDTRAPEVGVRRARLPTGGAMVMVKPAGTGPITVLSWSLMKNRPGIRYVALGLPGGAIDTFEKLDELALIDDLRALRPDLVILGYGSTEAMNDKLDVAHYQERYKGLLRLLKRMAPDASLAVAAPPDINRIPHFAAKLRSSPSAGCLALSRQERQEHDALISAGDERLARWYTPPRLDDIRTVMQRSAEAQGALYWDWSRLMGGPCGMHAWAHAKPELALPDHATLTDEGYQRSARALFGELLQGYASTPGEPGRQAAQK